MQSKKTFTRVFVSVLAVCVLCLAPVAFAAGTTADDVLIFTGNAANAGNWGNTPSSAKAVSIHIVCGAGPKSFMLKRGNGHSGKVIWETYTSAATNGTTYVLEDDHEFKIPFQGLTLITDDTTATLYLYTKGIQ